MGSPQAAVQLRDLAIGYAKFSYSRSAAADCDGSLQALSPIRGTEDRFNLLEPRYTGDGVTLARYYTYA
jgi:microcystin-dependent protein